MSWVMHRVNVLEILETRLDSGKFKNAKHPFLQSRFVIPLIKSFPHGDEMIAEYIEEEDTICAFILSQFSGFTAASYVDGVCQLSLTYIDSNLPAEKLEEIVSDLFKELPGRYLALHFELQDPDITAAEKFIGMRNTDVKICANNTSLPAGMEFEAYWAQRPKKIRKEIARSMRYLEKDNVSVDYKVITDGNQFDVAFKDYCALEGAGWKGEEGSALSESNTQGRFYKEVLDQFGRTGDAKIHQLLFDGVVVASLITIENDTMIIVIKTTYHQGYAKMSPGRLIDYYMLKNTLTTDNKKNIENYTNASSSDQKWFPRVRQMYDVTVYRNSLIKQAARLKQKIKP